MGQIRSHTGLRGAAALLVVFYHLSFLPNHVDLGQHFIRQCYLLVDLFFVLSGFIISYAYTAPVERGMSYLQFAQRRLVRLVPLHLFCLGYLLVGQVAMTFARDRGASFASLSPHWPVDLITQALLLNSFLPFSAGWNIPSWSISAELCAYAAFPLLVTSGVKRPVVTLAIGLFLSVGFYAVVGATTGSLDIITWPSPLRCLAGFMLGIAVYRARHLPAALSEPMISALQAACLVGAVAIMAGRINDVAVIPFFVGIALLTSGDRGWFAVVLNRPIPQYLGEISYSIYLNHVCLLTLAYPVWTAISRRSALSVPADRFAWLGLFLGLLIAISHLTFNHVERPARQRLTLWLKH